MRNVASLKLLILVVFFWGVQFSVAWQRYLFQRAHPEMRKNVCVFYGACFFLEGKTNRPLVNWRLDAVYL